MKKTLLFVLAVVVLAGFCTVGCAKKAANSQQAIEQSKSIKTVDEQAKYLVGQANAFMSSKEYDQAMQTAQYVLSNLDQNSAAAKDIITRGQEEMKKTAQAALGDMKNKFGMK